jgi:hypothetical protein
VKATEYNSNGGDSHVSSREKASPAGSTQRRGDALGRLVSGAFAASASSGTATGSGAPSHRRRRFVPLAVVTTGALVLMLAFVSSASAGQVRPFKETFGSAAQPTFGNPEGLAVDGSGDLLVIDAGNGTVSRWNPDGTPAGFSALGSNVIDGAGPGDGTPQGGLSFGAPNEVQVAVDDSGGVANGDIYVTQVGQSLIDVFGADGSFLGQLTGAGSEAFFEPCGVSVDESGDIYVGEFHEGLVYKFAPVNNPAENADNTAKLHYLEPCSVSAGMDASASSIFTTRYNGEVTKLNASTGATEYVLSEGSNTTTTVAPNSGNVLVAEGGNVIEYTASGPVPAKILTLQAESSVAGVAVNLAGEVYVAREGASQLEVFGAPASAPTPDIAPATKITGTKATLNGSVNAEDVPITECIFEWGPTTAYGHTAACEALPPTDSAPHPVNADISGLKGNGSTYHFRLAARNANGREVSADSSFQTIATVVTGSATGIGTVQATLNGMVRPEGSPYTECHFEYGLNSSSAFEHLVNCEPPVGQILADFSADPVQLHVADLKANSTYKFRLAATNGEGAIQGTTLAFTTQGPPQVTEVRASDAGQNSVTLGAVINPSGFRTTYQFEWATQAEWEAHPNIYGHNAPPFKRAIGSSNERIQVREPISGLSSGSTYHYRVVAENSVEEVSSPDHDAETLNSCELPAGRCVEMVSPPELGLIARPGRLGFTSELHFQASISDQGDLAYMVENGLPGATTGYEVLYKGTRGPVGWNSAQLSPPIVARNEENSGGSTASTTIALSDDLSCGVLTSGQPLTSDSVVARLREAGGASLFQRDSGGTYYAISNLFPENASEAGGPFKDQYLVTGMSAGCGKVLFFSPYHYPGIGGVGKERLYEWDEGTLRSVAIVPGPGGEVATEATGPKEVLGYHISGPNPVSEDGSRVFFTAERQLGNNPAEEHTTGVFVREEGTTTRDLSLSETSTPATGATYQWATPNGSRVFFTANSGLTGETSSTGTDLYEYDLEDSQLEDLSVDHEAGGAAVGAMLGASEDGSVVYFAAKGQLLPGVGNTFAQNQSAGTYSVYERSGRHARYVGLVRSEDLERVGAV